MYTTVVKTKQPLAPTPDDSTPTSDGTSITQTRAISPPSSTPEPQIPSSPYVVLDICDTKNQEELAQEKPEAVRRRIDDVLRELEESGE